MRVTPLSRKARHHDASGGGILPPRRPSSLFLSLCFASEAGASFQTVPSSGAAQCPRDKWAVVCSDPCVDHPCLTGFLGRGVRLCSLQKCLSGFRVGTRGPRGCVFEDGRPLAYRMVLGGDRLHWWKVLELPRAPNCDTSLTQSQCAAKIW